MRPPKPSCTWSPPWAPRYVTGTTFQGTLAQCQARITKLDLTPLPDPALAAAQKAKLAALASALNLALTAVFGQAPIQAQITFSNLAGPTGSVTRLIDAGQLAVAEAALQGMLTDQLVPPGYSAFIDPAVAAIVAAAPNFAAVAAATTVAEVSSVTVPAPAA